MRKLLGVAAVTAALAVTLAPAAGHADSYCVSTGLTIMGEPWLAHEQCVDCPVQDCPAIPGHAR